MTHAEMLERISAREIGYWRARFAIEVRGEQRLWNEVAVLRARVMQAAGGRPDPEDVFLYPPKQTEQSYRRQIESGGRVIDAVNRQNGRADDLG